MAKAETGICYLTGQLIRRELAARYRGSLLGVVWSLLTPLLMLAVYTFVFSVVFKTRWSGMAIQEGGSQADFALILFSGLALHQWLAECLSQAPTLISNQANYVKRVIFPLRIFPVVLVSTAFVQYLISMGILLTAMLVVYHSIPWTVLYLPVILLPFLLLLLGISWLLASLGVFIPDIRHVTGLLTTVLLFLSTIFYPAEALPEAIRAYIYLNPLSFIVDQIRAVCFWGKGPNWLLLSLYYAVGISVYFSGYWWFRTTRKGFADIL